MKRILFAAASVFFLNSAIAQDDDAAMEVVLPADAQKCVLPASPDAIPADATYEQLVEAKKQIAEFQGSVIEFRDCLHAAESNPENTPGNKQAIVSSYNYSVEMEERIAERFNVAVRSYKERKAAEES